MPPVPRSIFTPYKNSDSMMIIEQYPHGLYLWFNQYEKTFFDDCINRFCPKHDQFAIGSMDKDIFNDELFDRSLIKENIRIIKSFVYDGQRAVKIGCDDVIKLLPEHSNIVYKFEQEKELHRPGLKQLFQMYIMDGAIGDIYAIIENGKISAYLSCNPINRAIWDVDFIYVSPEKRKKGLETRLAHAYARNLVKGNIIPYYGSARNTESEHTALKAGFTCCRTIYTADVR